VASGKAAIRQAAIKDLGPSGSRRLFMSPATAKTHVSRAMGKLEVRGRAQLVVIAYESGLVRPGWLG
jgi:hypothetical protein